MKLLAAALFAVAIAGAWMFRYDVKTSTYRACILHDRSTNKVTDC